MSHQHIASRGRRLASGLALSLGLAAAFAPALRLPVLASPQIRLEEVVSSGGKKSSRKRKKHKKASAAKKTGKKAARKGTGSRAKQQRKDGFRKVGRKWYFYRDKKKQTGWIEEGGRRYYGKRSGSGKGSLLTGWQKIGGKEYYFLPSGRKGVCGSLCTDRVRKINGISCKFSKDGVYKGAKYRGSRSGFINRVGEMARENQRKNNILATVVVAQACLETGYGRVAPGHNLFGIYGGRYSSEQESMAAYNAYIRRYFPSLIGCRSYSVYAGRIGRGGYAQAGGYDSALLSIIRTYRLTRFSR